MLFFRKREKTPLFIHIPKTGGTYLTQGETDGDTVIKPIQIVGHNYFATANDCENPLYAGHDPERATGITIEKSAAKNRVVFSVVRNVFEWLVSYAGHAGYGQHRYVNVDHYDFENARKGFSYLLKTIANRTELWPNRKFLFCQNFASDGELMPNWILNNAHLDNELHRFACMNKLTYSQKRKQRVGSKKDFRLHFSDELVELTTKTWGREMKIYGHKFDAPSENAVLTGKVPDKVKKQLTYKYSSDELKFGDSVVSTQNFDVLRTSVAA